MRRVLEPVDQPTYRDVLRVHERLSTDYLADPRPSTLQRVLAHHARLIDELMRPGRFEIGDLALTPGAERAVRAGFHTPAEFLLRHRHGDWGDLCPEDQRANEDGLRHGVRLLSSYRTRLDDKLWVITEWDRSATTILLPEEY